MPYTAPGSPPSHITPKNSSFFVRWLFFLCSGLIGVLWLSASGRRRSQPVKALHRDVWPRVVAELERRTENHYKLKNPSNHRVF